MQVKPAKFEKLYLLLLLVCLHHIAVAQLIGGNVFIKGNYVEIGVAPNGAFGTTLDAPTGYHARPYYYPYSIFDTGSSTFTTRAFSLGFVADYGKDGWTVGSPAYYGDYFVPGLPQEGFSIQANGAISNAWTRDYINNHATGFSGTLYGSNTNYTYTSGVKQGIWMGTMGNLSVKQTTRLNDTDLFFTVSVVLKNTGSSTINNVYYVRTVDADNDWAISNGAASGSTINKIKYQLPNTSDRVLVTSTGTIYTNAYLGLGTKDCRAKVFYLDNGQVAPPSTITLQDLYNGTPTSIVHQSGADTADQGIGIVFDLGNIASGDSVTFAYAYILKEADLDVAINQTQPQLAHDGKNYSSGDTIKMCQNNGGAAVDIINGDFYSWSWSPSTGLSNTTGTHNVITLTSSTPVTYTLTGTSSMSSLCASKTLTIRIEPNIIPTPTVVPVTYCQGQTAIPLTATGSNILWYTSATGGTGVSSITPSTAVAGTFTYYATQTISGCESNRTPLVVTVYAPPAITESPANDTACINGISSFSIIATGGSLTYQWQEDSGTGFTNISNNSTYSGANSPSLTINNIPGIFNGYQYRCIIGGLCATTNITSASARLEVITAPSIITQPANTIICVGLSDTLNIAASGIKLAYQWQYKTPTGFIDLTDNSIFSGTNTTSLIISGATIANAGEYRCIVSNGCNPPDTSDAATVTISTAANIWRQPGDQYLCEGVTLTLEVLASGPIIAFQWQINDGTGWVNLIDRGVYTGTKSNLLRISSVNGSLDSTKLRCVVIGECITVYSNEINIWLYQQPKITAQPVDVLVNNNDPAVFEVGSSGVGVKYRWQASFTGSTFVFINDNGVYSGTKTPRLTINHASYSQNGTYFRCLLEEVGNCNYSDTTSDTARLWVHAPTSIGAVNSLHSIIVYPNPVENGQLYIQANIPNNMTLNATIINSVGQKIIQQSISFTNSASAINVSSLTPGIYVIQLYSKELNIQENKTITIKQ